MALFNLRYALLAAAALTVVPAGASAQSTPIVAEPPVVEVLMEVASEGAVCRPPEARLPARSAIELRLVNPSANPIRFMATQFLQSSEIEGATGAVQEGEGYLVGPGVSARISVRMTPAEGKFPFTCSIERQGKSLEGVGGSFVVTPSTVTPPS
jgi:hypothetical protein